MFGHMLKLPASNICLATGMVVGEHYYCYSEQTSEKTQLERNNTGTCAYQLPFAFLASVC